MEFDFAYHSIQEEKIRRGICLVLGIISILLALLFRFIMKYALFKGLALSFFIGGILLITMGLNFFTTLFHNNVINYGNKALQQIEDSLFNIYVCEIVLIVAILFGFILMIKIKDSALLFWRGMGIGIMIQALIILSLSINQSIKINTYLKLTRKSEIKMN